MWWGEAHLALVTLTLIVSSLGAFRESFAASLILLAWWVSINMLWELAGDQYVWTAAAGVLFYVGLFFTAMRIGTWLWWWLTALFGIVLGVTIVMWSSDAERLFMGIRGGLFVAMCIVVALSWGTRWKSSAAT